MSIQLINVVSLFLGGRVSSVGVTVTLVASPARHTFVAGPSCCLSFRPLRSPPPSVGVRARRSGVSVRRGCFHELLLRLWNRCSSSLRSRLSVVILAHILLSSTFASNLCPLCSLSSPWLPVVPCRLRGKLVGLAQRPTSTDARCSLPPKIARVFPGCVLLVRGVFLFVAAALRLRRGFLRKPSTSQPCTLSTSICSPSQRGKLWRVCI